MNIPAIYTNVSIRTNNTDEYISGVVLRTTQTTTISAEHDMKSVTEQTTVKVQVLAFPDNTVKWYDLDVLSFSDEAPKTTRNGRSTAKVA